jgi:hypothetical protein
LAEEVRRLTDLLTRCVHDPDLFNTAILESPPFWARQREIADSVDQYRITVAYTGNSVGKDYLVGRLIPWWLLTRAQSLIICTGPSQTILGSVTWKEVRRALEGARLPLGLSASQGIRCSPLRLTVKGDWGALGYSTTSVERASGQHNRKLLVIVDEASGVEDEIWDALDSLKYVRLLAIGNPIRAEGRFVQLIRQAARDAQDGIPPARACNAIRISSRESPDAGLWESPRGLADRTFIEDVERRYGKHSLWVKSHIDAEIPTVSAECLIPEAWLDWAARKDERIIPAGHPIHATRRIACDLGEGVGRDSSAILVRDDWRVLDVVFGSALGLPEAAEAIRRLKLRWGVPDERISYDRVGIGRDFPLHLRRRGIEGAVGYAGEGSPSSGDFPNLRSEAAWKLRQRLDPRHIPDARDPHAVQPFFAIPPGPFWHRLREELRTLSYSLVGRQTKLLPKKDWQTILGHSPDLADALIQSFAL